MTDLTEAYECDRATTLTHTYLPTYSSCRTGSKGWSSLMTSRFFAPNMKLKQVEGKKETKKPYNPATP